MRFLFLGGTQFLGRAAVEAALERGHEVTLFTRGRTNPGLFAGVEEVYGDRTSDPLPEGRWDAVVDTSGYFPGVVRRSAEALRGRAGRYLFVSSVSVYEDMAAGADESSPRLELGDQPIDEMLPGYENYGALKALCEDVARDVFGEDACIVRPGLIVGPHDPTGRFTYWPHRVARGGEVLLPAPPEQHVQVVDARDLAGWIVELLEREDGGTYNATHPGFPWQELFDACVRVTGSDAGPVWIPAEFLLRHQVGEWMELPMWLARPEWADVSRALAAGLRFRPLDETVRGALEQAGTTADAGLAPEREAELLRAWRQR